MPPQPPIRTAATSNSCLVRFHRSVPNCFVNGLAVAAEFVSHFTVSTRAKGSSHTRSRWDPLSRGHQVHLGRHRMVATRASTTGAPPAPHTATNDSQTPPRNVGLASLPPSLPFFQQVLVVLVFVVVIAFSVVSQVRFHSPFTLRSSPVFRFACAAAAPLLFRIRCTQRGRQPVDRLVARHCPHQFRKPGRQPVDHRVARHCPLHISFAHLVLHLSFANTPPRRELVLQPLVAIRLRHVQLPCARLPEPGLLAFYASKSVRPATICGF